MALDRVLQNTATTIYGGFAVGGTAENPSPDSATVVVKRADGTTLITSTAATDVGAESPGLFSKTLTAAHTADLDTLTAYWTATVDGAEQTVTTTHEVVGGYFFTVVEFYDAYPDIDSAVYTPAKVAQKRTLAEQTIERNCFVAFVPRAARRTLSGTGETVLWLPNQRIRTIESASDADGALDLTDLTIEGSRAALANGVWTVGSGNLTLSYTHGHDRPEEPLREAAMLFVRERIVPKHDHLNRATQTTVDGVTVNLATPGMFGAVTGIPDVDAAIADYAEPVYVA